MNLENALRKIQPNRANFFHRTAPIPAVHKATALWHIAMPVVGAVHCIMNGSQERATVACKTDASMRHAGLVQAFKEILKDC